MSQFFVSFYQTCFITQALSSNIHFHFVQSKIDCKTVLNYGSDMLCYEIHNSGSTNNKNKIKIIITLYGNNNTYNNNDNNNNNSSNSCSISSTTKPILTIMVVVNSIYY